MMPLENIFGLGDYKIKQIKGNGSCIMEVSYEGAIECPHCESSSLRTKGRIRRRAPRKHQWEERLP